MYVYYFFHYWIKTGPQEHTARSMDCPQQICFLEWNSNTVGTKNKLPTHLWCIRVTAHISNHQQKNKSMTTPMKSEKMCFLTFLNWPFRSKAVILNIYPYLIPSGMSAKTDVSLFIQRLYQCLIFWRIFLVFALYTGQVEFPLPRQYKECRHNCRKV